MGGGGVGGGRGGVGEGTAVGRGARVENANEEESFSNMASPYHRSDSALDSISSSSSAYRPTTEPLPPDEGDKDEGAYQERRRKNI